MSNKLNKMLTQLFAPDAKIVDSDGSVLKFNKYFKASKDELEELQIKLGFILPLEYLDFLSFSNGCIMYNFNDIDGYYFYNTTEMIKENEYFRKTYFDNNHSDIIVIGFTFGEHDFLGLKKVSKDEYSVIDCYPDGDPSDWNTISISFDIFVEELIINSGKKFWFNSGIQ